MLITSKHAFCDKSHRLISIVFTCLNSATPLDSPRFIRYPWSIVERRTKPFRQNPDGMESLSLLTAPLVKKAFPDVGDG